MDKLLKLLKDKDIEVTDDLKEEIQKIYPEEVDTDDLFTQEDVNKIVKDRLTREQKLHEQEIKDLKKEMEGMIDPDKAEEYEKRIEELKGEADKREAQMKQDYELQLAAKDAGIKDQEYFEFLVEKKGYKDRLKLDDEGNVVATDKDGNILTEEGKKLGPDALVNELKEDKPDVFNSEKKKKKSTGGTNPEHDDLTDDEKKAAAKNMAAELGYKKKDKE